MNLLPVSHRQQIQQADCLAACAAMVLDYLQIPVDYRSLLKLLNVKEFGTSFLSLQNIERLGLHVLALEGDIPTLERWLQGLPPIVAVSTGQLTSYWKEDTDHAVVVIGVAENSIFLHDPDQATGPQQVERIEFESAWLEQNYWCAVIGLDAFEEQP